MIIIVLSTIIVIGFLILLLMNPKKNTSETDILLKKIMQLSTHELNLEKSIQIIEYARKYTMIFINDKDSLLSSNPPLKKCIHKLLGLILQVPRQDKQDILQAIHNIEIINDISLEIKNFFISNYDILKKG